MNSKQKGLSLLWRLWPWIKRQRLKFYIVFLLAPLVAGLQLAGPNLVRLVIDRGMIAKDHQALLTWTLLFVLVFILSFGLRSLQRYLTAVFVQRVVRDLRSDLVRRVVHFPAGFHDRQLSGVLVTRATSDFDALNESLGQGVFGALADLIAISGSLTALIIIAGPLALVAILFLPLVAGFTGICSRALQKAIFIARSRLAELNGFTQECLTSLPTIKALTAREAARREYQKSNHAYRDAQMKSVVLDALLYSSVEGLAAIALGATLWAVTGDLVKGLSAGVLIATVTCLQQIFEPLKEFTNRIAILQGVFTALERIFGLMDVNEKTGGSKRPKISAGKIQLKELSFSYAKAGESPREIISDLSLSVESGESLALVGATGCGKTTLIRLLSGEYDHYRGSLRIDGQELASLDPLEYRKLIGLVPQEPEIFTGSIEFNVSLNRAGITEAKVLDALTRLGAGGFIKKLAEGIKTELLEGGANLSQGQRQLIVFARAIVTDPLMLFLDEATASLDPESERLVQRATTALFKGRTVVVVAHRLSTVKRSNKIIVLDEGRVVESGRHEDLVRLKGVYHEMLSSFVGKSFPQG